jgi:hypothetical protein
MLALEEENVLCSEVPYCTVLNFKASPSESPSAGNE